MEKREDRRREDRNQDNRGRSRGSYGSRSSRFRSRRRVCVFCADKTKTLDWKKADDLHRFVGDSGEILPRRKNGLCARHQRGMAVAIKRARHLALLPYTNDHIRIMSQG